MPARSRDSRPLRTGPPIFPAAATPSGSKAPASPATFSGLLGSVAAIGRALEPADESGSGRVAVLTDGLWRRRFAADPAIVGRDVLLNGASYTVVGILPAGFLFPFRDAEVAVPLRLRDDPRRTDRGANFLRVVARLQPKITVDRGES
jgi:hypothetical protein